MLEEPMKRTALCGGGLFLSAASKARISFSHFSLGDLSAATSGVADETTKRAARIAGA
jgi:hypothetical protein